MKCFAPFASATAKRCFRFPPAATMQHHPPSPAKPRTSEHSITKCWALNLTTHRVLWRYEHPERHFPFYSSAAVADGKVVIGGRDKIVHCLDAQHRQDHLDLHHQRARGFVAGHLGRPGLRRLERRAALRARSGTAERNSRSSTRVRRCPRRLLSRPENSSSARRTASCSAWDKSADSSFPSIPPIRRSPSL